MKVRLECTRARHSGASKVFRTVGSFAELGDGGRAKAQRGGRGENMNQTIWKSYQITL